MKQYIAVGNDRVIVASFRELSRKVHGELVTIRIAADGSLSRTKRRISGSVDGSRFEGRISELVCAGVLDEMRINWHCTWNNAETTLVLKRTTRKEIERKLQDLQDFVRINGEL